MTDNVFLKIEITNGRYLYEIFVSSEKDQLSDLVNKGYYKSEAATVVALKRIIRKYK
jgi:hypothetical protein